MLLGGAAKTLTDKRFTDNAMTDGVSRVGGGTLATIGGDFVVGTLRVRRSEFVDSRAALGVTIPMRRRATAWSRRPISPSCSDSPISTSRRS